MGTHSRAGLMAAGIVLGGASLVLLAVLALAGGDGQGRGGGGSPGRRVVVEGGPRKAPAGPTPSLGELARHPYWKRRMSEVDVSRIVDQLTHPGCRGIRVAPDGETFDDIFEGVNPDKPRVEPARDAAEAARNLGGSLDRFVGRRDYIERYP